MFKTIFFDFGNVIAFFDHWRAVRGLAHHTDMKGDELFARLYDSPLEHAFEQGRISTEEYVAEAMRIGRLKCTQEEFLEHFRDIFTPNADVIEAIPHLAKQHRLCLASNTNDAHFRHYCRLYAEPLSHFAALPTSHQAGHRKPTKGFYDYCQQFAEAEPGECLFVDDVSANIEGARRHGWQTLHYQKGVKLLEALSAINPVA